MFSYEDAPERGCPFFVSENVNGALFFCGIVEKGSVVRRAVFWYADCSRDLCNCEKGDDRMMLGKVIRKYRKERNFTQEEMAERLGVTASAVNKWEREVTCPDIALLAPIARLLEISTDTLLSYRENLTPKEIKELMEKTQKMLKETSYGEAFAP